MIKPTGNLRELILLCLENIKGLSRRTDIERLLPINDDNFFIDIQDIKVIIEYNNTLLGHIWPDTNCYSNLEILKLITNVYEIDFKNEEILELVKYKNKITLMLL